MTPLKGRKTRRWYIQPLAGGVLLGYVVFRPQWRRYVFAPEGGTQFDHKCLDEIVVFLENQTKAWKAGLK